MELVPDQVEVLGRSTSRRTEAYQAYLKGRYHWNRGGFDGATSAIAYYERALDIDPGFAAAHASMARARIALANQAREPGRGLLERARSAAMRAIEIDPGVSDAHVALAEVRRALEWNWRWPKMSTARPSPCRPAVRRRIVFSRSFSHPTRGSPRLKPRPIARATSILFASLLRPQRAWVRYLAGEHHAAIDRCRHVLEMDSGFTSARRILGAALLGAGKPHEAVSELALAVGPDGGWDHDYISFAWLAHAKALAGSGDEAGAMVSRARLPGRAIVCVWISSRARACRAWETVTKRSICSNARAPTAIRRLSTWPSNLGSSRCIAIRDTRRS